MDSTALRPLNWNNEAPPFDSNLVLLKIKAEEDAQLMLAIFSFFFFFEQKHSINFCSYDFVRYFYIYEKMEGVNKEVLIVLEGPPQLN